MPKRKAQRALEALVACCCCASIAFAAPLQVETIPSNVAELGWDPYQDPFEAISTRVAQDPPRSLVDSPQVSQVKRDWQIPTDDLPPYPVWPWIIQNDTSWPTLANAVVRRMQTWYWSDTNTYDSLSWWQFPVLLISYMDLDRATGQDTNRRAITRILNANERGKSYIIDAYVDDQAWWGVALMRAYSLYGTEAYLSASKTIFQSDVSYWTGDCGGGLLWLTYKPEFGKNTITNTLHISLAARLYSATGEDTYLQSALRTFRWWIAWAYDPATGKITDTLKAYTCEKDGEQIFTYNSGAALYALTDLYTATQNQTYLDIATNIAHAAMRDYSISIGIMRESCEYFGAPNGGGGVSAADGGPKNNLPAGCQTDTIMFKSILASGLGHLHEATRDFALYSYLARNLMSSALYNMDETFLQSEWWDGPFNTTLANQFTQANAIGLLSAGVSANIRFQNNKLNASGQAPLELGTTYSLPLPTGRQNPADTTELRKRNWLEPRATA